MFLSAGEYIYVCGQDNRQTIVPVRAYPWLSSLLSSSWCGFISVGLRKFCSITHCC